MPRFHFNVYDGHSTLDTEGSEYPSWEAARLDAIRLAGEIIKDEASRVAHGEHWRMEMTDAAGVVLFRLDFAVAEAPVLSSQRTSHRPSA